jgi:hypothetical protein
MSASENHFETEFLRQRIPLSGNEVIQGALIASMVQPSVLQTVAESLFGAADQVSESSENAGIFECLDEADPSASLIEEPATHSSFRNNDALDSPSNEVARPATAASPAAVSHPFFPMATSHSVGSDPLNNAADSETTDKSPQTTGARAASRTGVEQAALFATNHRPQTRDLRLQTE